MIGGKVEINWKNMMQKNNVATKERAQIKSFKDKYLFFAKKSSKKRQSFVRPLQSRRILIVHVQIKECELYSFCREILTIQL